MAIKILCDIDGVVADVKEEVNRYLPDWKEFFSHLSEVRPISEVIEVILGLIDGGNEVIFMTGRPSNFRKVTREWLLYNIPYLNSKSYSLRLLMRPIRNYDKPEDLKLRYCRWCKPDLILEDDPRVVSILVKEGFTVLQVHGYRATSTDTVPYREE